MVHVAGLVGRQAELEIFEQACHELEQGRPAALEVVGEPGIGKTRILGELERRAESRGQLVLSGSASELERDLPLAVFVDALDDYVHSLDERRLVSLDDDVRKELAAIFPSLSLLAPRGKDAHNERYRSYRAVRELLELLAARKPLVLVLDDLHWADPASVELVGALLRRPPAAPVLLALALRPRQVSERLSAALARAQRGGSLARAELTPLTLAEARELLGDEMAGLAERLHAESGGNPFYLEELARSTHRLPSAPGEVAEISLLGVDVPPLVVAALSEELALLSETARLVLEGAAVAGDPFEPELAAAAAGTSEESAIESLDVLLGLDLIRTTDVPRRYRFRHPLLRRAVYDSAPSGWRLGAHERSAEALAARGASALSRAHHVERSARQGDSTGVAVLREAGEAAAHLAPGSAARWFTAALRLVSDDAPTEERVELLLALARVLAASGSFAESRSALITSVALVPEESTALRLQLMTACAGVEHLLGHHEQAHRRLVSALDALDDHDSADAVALMLELVVDGYYRMEYEQMRHWSERAAIAAKPLGDPLLNATALATLAYSCALTRAATEADEHRAEAAALIDALPDLELGLRLGAAVNLAAAELNLGRLTDAILHAERALVIGRATGQSEFVPTLVYCLGWAKRLGGQLVEGAELLDTAIESARVSGNTQSLVGSLLNRSLVALAAGDVELALSTAEEGVSLASQLDRSLVSASVGMALAAVLVETGDPRRAVDVLVGPSGGDELPLIPRGWRASWLELLTRCWLALGRVDEAERSARLAREAAAASELRLALALADRAAAAVALDTDPSRAADLALASATAAESVGARIEAALSRTLAGRALAQADRQQEAIAELLRATTELDDCGALGYRAAAERELRSLGHRVHRRTRPGSSEVTNLDSLTGRELEIARLIAALKTNPEIAAALFLSPKTVESHIRNIFRKLGVTSRVQVARAVERADAEDGASSPTPGIRVSR